METELKQKDLESLKAFAESHGWSLEYLKRLAKRLRHTEDIERIERNRTHALPVGKD